MRSNVQRQDCSEEGNNLFSVSAALGQVVMDMYCSKKDSSYTLGVKNHFIRARTGECWNRWPREMVVPMEPRWTSTVRTDVDSVGPAQPRAKGWNL